MNSARVRASNAREQFNGLRVAHVEERRVSRLLRAGLVAGLSPCTVPLVIGGVGLGKTDLAERVVAEFVSARSRNAPAYVNVPPANRRADEYDMRPVCRRILRAVGRPAELIDAVGAPPWENERSSQALIDTTRDELALRQPGALTLDEIERLVAAGVPDAQPVDTIAWWADEARVPIVAIGNYQAALALRGSKLSRRLLVIHYQPYEGRDGYRNYLEGMAPLVEHLRSTDLAAKGIDWDEVCRMLYAASHGRVGESKRVLDFALELSEERVTHEEIVAATDARLSPVVQAKFEKDFEWGRSRLAEVEHITERPATERVAPRRTRRIGRHAAIVPTGLTPRP